MDHRIAAIRRAIEYGERPRVAGKMTGWTIQGRMETGYVVWGRSFGGDRAGCLFASRALARDAIRAAKGEE